MGRLAVSLAVLAMVASGCVAGASGMAPSTAKGLDSVGGWAVDRTRATNGYALFFRYPRRWYRYAPWGISVTSFSSELGAVSSASEHVRCYHKRIKHGVEDRCNAPRPRL